jgi:hypothetical protein
MNKKSIFIMFFAVFSSIASVAMAGDSANIFATNYQQQTIKALSEQSDHNHVQHHHDVNKRGDKAMGFSHEKTTHHFRLFKDGGAIEVNANEAKDTASMNKIRMHLSHIAHMFSEGNFSTPMLVHNELPPGAKTMAQMKTEIAYQYEETKSGGRVRISTDNEQALAAIYDFLRYQIKEHQTGDSLEVSKP